MAEDRSEDGLVLLDLGGANIEALQENEPEDGARKEELQQVKDAEAAGFGI